MFPEKDSQKLWWGFFRNYERSYVTME